MEILIDKERISAAPGSGPLFMGRGGRFLMGVHGVLHELDEPFRRRAEGLFPLPCKDAGARERRRKGTDADLCPVPEGDGAEDGDGAGQTAVHQHGAAGGQIGGAEDVEMLIVRAEPPGELTADGGATG